jgi:type VI secretion system protein ImpE
MTGRWQVTAAEFFQAGQLPEAVQAQIQKIKSRPADQAARLFLVELLLFQGDWERAQKHLDMLQYESPQAQAGLELIRNALAAEQERRQVLQGQAQPMGLKDSPEHVRLRLLALEHYAQQKTAEGDRLLREANAAQPTVACEVDGQKISSCRDGDELFGTVLEVFSRGRYCWVPMEQMAKLTIVPPQSPRDLLFIPAHLEMQGGLEGDVHLPGLYPDTTANNDADIRLGRATEWLGEEDGPFRGAGGKILLLDETAKPLVQIRQWIASTS